MRKILLALLLVVLLPALTTAQSFIRYYPPGGLMSDGANTFALQNGTSAQALNIYNTFTDGSNYERATLTWSSIANRFRLMTEKAGSGSSRDIQIYSLGSLLLNAGAGAGWTVDTSGFFIPSTTDTIDIGSTSQVSRNLYLSRSTQGSKSKSLTDAGAAVSIWRIAVPTNGYAGGDLIFTANSTDGTDRLATTGRVTFSGADTAGTVTCGIGTPYGISTAYRRANTLVCTFTAVTSTTNCDVQVTCTDNKAAAQTMTIESRLDMPAANTVTPQ